MGHVKEPKGVDFFIKSEPLSDLARKEISEFIRNYKSEATSKTKRKKTKLAKKQHLTR